ncbi:MAG: FtsQ-type POTRA domain-containing protein [Clostridia bacterium]|nr:FtsQ-type POTRA domain-containing protein [Clostridia bacterium]
MTKPMSAKQKRKRKLARMRRRFFLFLLLFAAILSLLLFTPWFNIKTIEVTGNELIAKEQILEASAISEGANIFRINKRAVKKAILKIPEIDGVTISRRLPLKVRISVLETKPVLYFPYLSGYVITNEKGKVLALKDDISSLGLLNITGLEIKNAEICEKITVQDMVKFDIIIETLGVLQEKGLLDQMRSGHFDDLSDVYFYLNDGTKIIFGKTTEMEYKISVLSNVLPMVNRTEGSYIDLTTPSRTVYGTLDEEPPAETEQDPSAENTAGDSQAQSGAEDIPANAETAEAVAGTSDESAASGGEEGTNESD